MRIVIQRVLEASVRVSDQEVARIGPGIVVFVGFASGDDAPMCVRCAQEMLRMRMFDDGGAGRLSRSVAETGGAILVVPEITLTASLAKGRRPSFDGAAPAGVAKALFEAFVQALYALHPHVSAGMFQAHMAVSLINDGPVTFVVDWLTNA